ncbi:MAG: branched-chain amino acid ABC transporter permease, partial [Bdellovibrionales bacterium]|nr:branched-chain amino acid ABC transporter permease [Bdellovibrionales bacterium]
LFYLFSVELSLSFFPACLSTLSALFLLAAGTLFVFVLPFSRYNLILTFLTTLTLSTVLESLVAMTFGVNVKSLFSESWSSSIEFFGIYITPIQIVIISSGISLLILLSSLVHLTPLGRRIRALSANGAAAQSLGVSEKGFSLGIFSLGVVLAGYAGILVGYESNLQPTMGGIFTIKAFAAMVLGGLGNIWGTLLGAYILGFIENFSLGLTFWGQSLPASWKDAFAFVIIVVVLLFRPNGLFGAEERKS